MKSYLASCLCLREHEWSEGEDPSCSSRCLGLFYRSAVGVTRRSRDSKTFPILPSFGRPDWGWSLFHQNIQRAHQTYRIFIGRVGQSWSFQFLGVLLTWLNDGKSFLRTAKDLWLSGAWKVSLRWNCFVFAQNSLCLHNFIMLMLFVFNGSSLGRLTNEEIIKAWPKIAPKTVFKYLIS